MKLFSIKTLSTTLLLSSTILLSACGGNSGSSGDNKDNYSLKGYWQSECLTADMASPTIVYYHITETNDKLKSEEIVQEFKGKNCTGVSHTTNHGVFDLGTQKNPKIDVEFINKDIFLHLQNDEATDYKTEKTKFSRISKDIFDKVK